MKTEGNFSVKSAYEVISRLIDDVYTKQIDFQVRNDSETDCFEIAGDAGRIVIQGTSPVVMLAGFNWYLKYVVECNISWNGKQIDLPEILPAPEKSIFKESNVKNRFALNDTDDGYTQPYGDWEYWENKIDILALHGMNEVLVFPGQEAVYYETFRKFGYLTEELLEWIPRPAHQPWWFMQNMGSYPSPMSEGLLNKRVQLGKKICKRLNELGITPVFPGYYGMVPPEFNKKHPDSHVIPQGSWVGFDQPDWLSPTCDIYKEIAKLFYRIQETLFGKTNMFKMDLLHEAGNAGEVNIGEASKAVQNALEAAHPDAVWVVLGWQDKPEKELLAAVDKKRMLILDGLADRYNMLDRETEWKGTPYAFGSIWNFGGHTTMGANISFWNKIYWHLLDKENTSLAGIAILPEASDNNPVAFDFISEMAWRTEPVSLDNWFNEWAKRRYGRDDKNAIEAWKALQNSAYDMPPDGWSEAQDGLFSAEPDLAIKKAATWSPEAMRYDKNLFADALTSLLQVDVSIVNSSAYKYDLMDVTRQVLANESRTLLPMINEAYKSKYVDEFKNLTNKWLNLIELLDQVVGTNEQTMLGPWLERAKKYGADQNENAKNEYDARQIGRAHV